MTKLLAKSDFIELQEKCRVYFSELKPLMATVRKHVDDPETKMPDDAWLLPKYKEMLFIC